MSLGNYSKLSAKAKHNTSYSGGSGGRSAAQERQAQKTMQAIRARAAARLNAA